MITLNSWQSCLHLPSAGAVTPQYTKAPRCFEWSVWLLRPLCVVTKWSQPGRDILLVFRHVWFPPSLPTAVPTVLCSLFIVEDACSRAGLEFLAGRNSVMSWCFSNPLDSFCKEVEAIPRWWWWGWCRVCSWCSHIKDAKMSNSSYYSSGNYRISRKGWKRKDNFEPPNGCNSIHWLVCDTRPWGSFHCMDHWIMESLNSYFAG